MVLDFELMSKYETLIHICKAYKRAELTRLVGSHLRPT